MHLTHNQETIGSSPVRPTILGDMKELGKVQLLTAALRLAGFDIDEKAVELFLEVQKAVEEKGEEYTIRDAVRLRLEFDKRYEKECAVAKAER